MALPTKLTLEIVTPDRALVAEPVDEVELPGTDGYFGVLPGHTPLLASLSVGELWYRVGQEKHYLSLAFGFAEVLPERVTVLAQIAERAQDIDVARAERARKRAEERLAHARGRAPRHLPVYRDVVQPPAAALDTRVRQSSAVRTAVAGGRVVPVTHASIKSG
jgi:F-type H+-transporting ATPase subunit epsilon